uniref:Putative secreted protein n=1 Tax=Xenopsylla cheopis TaxID=163159 RepID=A0A6M2DV60_XENCH
MHPCYTSQSIKCVIGFWALFAPATTADLVRSFQRGSLVTSRPLNIQIPPIDIHKRASVGPKVKVIPTSLLIDRLH